MSVIPIRDVSERYAPLCSSCCQLCPASPLDKLNSHGVNVNLQKRTITVLEANEKYRVSENSIRALCMLWQSLNDICDRDELKGYIWQDICVVNNNLNVTISVLRQALDKSSFRIQCIRGRGYRLVGGMDK